ncbi:MAG: hypothetical protein AAGF93_12430 [Cyanobacteria bacterium P01_H01_bin.105]
MLFDQGKLEKLVIYQVLAEPKQPWQVIEDKGPYKVQVNPNSYTLNHVVNHHYRRGQGITNLEEVHCSTEPTKLEFEFLFDGTGVVPAPSDIGDIPVVGAIDSLLNQDEVYNVEEQIKAFNKFVYERDGEIHRQPHLLLIWGTLTFPCILASVSYRYTLFKPDGTPLRAVAACRFTESRSKLETALTDKDQSPDLTHLREVKDGDTLPLMSHRIYGKTDFYLEVARVNKLVNFRRLRSGSQLAFPPVNKEAKR